jgi:hypothetical protein
MKKTTPKKSAPKLLTPKKATAKKKTPMLKRSKPNLPGYPIYPAAEDIFNRGKEESAIDPEDLTKTKSINEEGDVNNEKDFDDDRSGGDLDVPGSELDDQQESVGSEDEENNAYSIGGDDHNDLEEDKGD